MRRPQTPSRGCILYPLCLCCPNTPSRWRLRSPHRCWVPFSSIPFSPIGALELHRFGPECPKCPKMVQKQSTPVFDHFSGSSRFVGLCSKLFLEKSGEITPPPRDLLGHFGPVMANFGPYRDIFGPFIDLLKTISALLTIFVALRVLKKHR